MKKLIIIVLIVVIAVATSCKKDLENSSPFVNSNEISNQQDFEIDNTPQQSKEINIEDYLSDNTTVSDLITTKTNGYYCPADLSYTQTPYEIRKDHYKSNPEFRNSYQHIAQPDNTSCSWTSYIILASCIIKANCSPCSYPVTASRIYEFKKLCGDSKLITNLKEQANKRESRIRAENKFFERYKRFETTREMINHLHKHNSPFIVIGTFHKANGGKVGHYLIVHSILWTQNEKTSKVYYTDCSSANGQFLFGNLKCKSLYTFLNEMTTCTIGHNMLFIYKKQ